MHLIQLQHLVRMEKIHNLIKQLEKVAVVVRSMLLVLLVVAEVVVLVVMLVGL